jgi:hypothetical protein
MRHRVVTLVALLIGVASVVFAEGGCDKQISDPDAFLASLSAQAGGLPAQSAPELAATKAICNALAYCGSTTVSCSHNNPGSLCIAVDQNCSAGIQGYVQCGSAVINCPACATCTEGAYWEVATGNCCDSVRGERERFQCIGGQWEFVGYACRRDPFCLVP